MTERRGISSGFLSNLVALKTSDIPTPFPRPTPYPTQLNFSAFSAQKLGSAAIFITSLPGPFA